MKACLNVAFRLPRFQPFSLFLLLLLCPAETWDWGLRGLTGYFLCQNVHGISISLCSTRHRKASKEEQTHNLLGLDQSAISILGWLFLYFLRIVQSCFCSHRICIRRNDLHIKRNSSWGQSYSIRYSKAGPSRTSAIKAVSYRLHDNLTAWSLGIWSRHPMPLFF